MKKLTLLAFLIIASVHFTFAQNTIAKLKFEEAEEAYSNNNFDLTLTKLKEVEGLLKSTNPKILYLQILAQTKIIKKDWSSDYLVIVSAKISIEKYLRDYDNLPDNEDKYREVYKISELFKDAPTSLEDFNERIRQGEINKAKKQQDETEKIKKGEEAFMIYVYLKNYEIGLTLEEAKIKFPDFFSKYWTTKVSDQKHYDRMYTSKNTNGIWFFGKNGKISGYLISRDSSSLTEMVENLTVKFNFKPTINNGIYTWEKNGKLIYISSTYVSQYDN